MIARRLCSCCVEAIDGEHCNGSTYDAYKNYTHVFASTFDLCNYCPWIHGSTSESASVRLATIASAYLLADGEACNRDLANQSCDSTRIIYDTPNYFPNSIAKQVPRF